MATTVGPRTTPFSGRIATRLVALILLLLVLYLLVKIPSGTGGGRLPLVLTEDEDGGFVVSSPILPELNTEGDNEAEAIANARDAQAAVRGIYRQIGRKLPREARAADPAAIEFEVTIRPAAEPAA
jgi:antitoxin HicB